MGTHNVCLFKEVDKKYTGCNLKTTKMFDCAFIRVCAVIWWNTVYMYLVWIFNSFNLAGQNIYTFANSVDPDDDS